jgi:hypothetical protein
MGASGQLKIMHRVSVERAEVHPGELRAASRGFAVPLNVNLRWGEAAPLPPTAACCQRGDRRRFLAGPNGTWRGVLVLWALGCRWSRLVVPNPRQKS